MQFIKNIGKLLIMIGCFIVGATLGAIFGIASWICDKTKKVLGYKGG